MPTLSTIHKDRIRSVLQACNRNLYTNLEYVDHPDQLYYDGHLTMDDLDAILAILRQCTAEMARQANEER
jgi:hypothetical protein